MAGEYDGVALRLLDKTAGFSAGFGAGDGVRGGGEGLGFATADEAQGVDLEACLRVVEHFFEPEAELFQFFVGKIMECGGGVFHGEAI